MKTVYTCLPIYDRLSKQCYERSKCVGGDKDMMAPTITPRHRLPAFQWIDGTDGAATVSRIELIDTLGESYNRSCGYLGWGNSYDVFASSGLEITNAVVTGASAKSAYTSQGYFAKAGETIRIRGTYHTISDTSGNASQINIYNNGGSVYSVNLTEGVNTITHTFGADSGPADPVIVYVNSIWGPKQFTFTDVEISIDLINQLFPTLPASHAMTGDVYFMYNGDTLNYLLPEGLYYLKITMNTGHIYYSEWFLVDCVYENLIETWTNNGYNTFSSSGTRILSAIETGANGDCYSEWFDCIIGEKITVIFYLTLNSGTKPGIVLTDFAGADPLSDATTAGLNEIEFTATITDQYRLTFQSAVASNFLTSEILVIRSFSEKYLAINFEHSCDLGDIQYADGFQQVLYLESETMEPTFPYTEKGAENGYGSFVPTFQRQDKFYLIKTKLIAQYIVDVLHRLKLHDTILITDSVGDVNTVEEIDVEHEWQFEDKYYATATLTVNLGDQIVITGCCTAINECS